MNRIVGLSVLAGMILSGCVRYHPRPISPEETASRLENRSLKNSELQRFVRQNLGEGATNSAEIVWNFDALLLAAFYYHPSLEEARDQWRIAQAEVKTAGGRPNPSVSVLPEYNFTPSSGMSPWLPAITIDWPVETAGKRGYRIARSEHLSEAARLNIAAAAWQVRGKLRSAMLQVAGARRREVLLEGQFASQEQLVNLLSQRLRAGAISSVELAPPRLALAKTRMDLIDAKRRKAEAWAGLAEATGVNVGALNEIDVVTEVSNPSPMGRELVSTELRGQALRSRTDVLASLAEYEASQSALQLEIAKQYPDIHIGTGYQWDEGGNKWQLGVTAEIPVLNRNEGPIAEAEARRKLAGTKLQTLQTGIIADLDRAVESFRAAEKDLAALEELASLQKTQLEQAQAQVRAGAADQVDLLNAQVEFHTGELTRVEVLIKANETLINLENAVQRPMDLPRVNPSIEVNAR